MTVTDIRKDPETCTMTITSSFVATADQVWSLWADPRLLERWWGPPTYPATVDEHALEPGGEVKYHMTGPEGDQSHGYWRILAVEAPRSLELEDGFANPDGTPNADAPAMKMRLTITDAGDGRTEMAIATTFPSLEAMEQMVAMGMEEGMREALGQIDALLAGS
jgi:uncharacterized protein YndB with AHSA1/START domain